MAEAILVDLGNTLVQYFERAEFPEILERAIAGVAQTLRERGLPAVPEELVRQRVQDEDHEAPDFRVRPLEDRLRRIFHDEAVAFTDETLDAMCRSFMAPVFARSVLDRHAAPVLRELRSRGIRIAIVSNTTWGSPAHLWREELQRFGLDACADVAVFCRDVGWRKPAAPIFLHTLGRLGLRPDQCLFVGDDPRWDGAGPRAVGIEAYLLDRTARPGDGAEGRLASLQELLNLAR